MLVNGNLAGPEIHFELRYYFVINKLFITNFYCVYIYIYIYIYIYMMMIDEKTSIPLSVRGTYIATMAPYLNIWCLQYFPLISGDSGTATQL